MADDVAKLLIQVSATTELLRSNLNKAERAVADFERNTNKRLSKVDKGFSGLGKGLGTIKGALAGFTGGAFAGLLASLSTGAITSAISNSLEFAGSLGEIAQSLGVGTKFLQEFRFAATQNGATLEQADTALGKFSITLGRAFGGNKAAADSLTSLGLSLEKLKGQSDSERFQSVADAIAKIKDPARQAASAVDIFGRGALAILPTLQQAGAGFRKSAAEAQKFGLILSDKQIQDADHTADKIAKLKQALATKVAGVVSSEANAIGELTDALADLAAQAINATVAYIRWQRAQSRNIQIKDENRGAQTVYDGMFFRLKRNTKRALPKGGRGGGRVAVGTEFRPTDDLLGKSALSDAARAVLGSSGGGGGGGSRSRGLARELKEADPLAQQIADSMADISRDAVDVGQSIREDWNNGGRELSDTVDKINAKWEDEHAARIEAMRQDADLQQQQIRDLAGLYETLFTDGTKGFLRVLKYEGIRAISEMLARLSQGQSAFGGGGGGLFGSLFSAVGSIFGGSGSLGGSKSTANILGRASGGPVNAGQPYIVGERRPELFVPNRPGTIIPSLKGLGGGAGGIHIHQTINAPGATAETVAMIRRELANAAPTIVSAAKASTLRDISRPRI